MNNTNSRDSAIKNKVNEVQNQMKPAAPAERGHFTKYVTVAVIAFIVGLGLGLSITKNPSGADKKVDALSSEVSEVDGNQKNNSSVVNVIWPEVPADVLTVSDQVPGLHVKIDKVNV